MGFCVHLFSNKLPTTTDSMLDRFRLLGLELCDFFLQLLELCVGRDLELFEGQAVVEQVHGQGCCSGVDNHFDNRSSKAIKHGAWAKTVESPPG